MDRVGFGYQQERTRENYEAFVVIAELGGRLDLHPEQLDTRLNAWMARWDPNRDPKLPETGRISRNLERTTDPLTP